jgi:hypothetical protein
MLKRFFRVHVNCIAFLDRLQPAAMSSDSVNSVAVRLHFPSPRCRSDSAPSAAPLAQAESAPLYHRSSPRTSCLSERLHTMNGFNAWPNYTVIGRSAAETAWAPPAQPSAQMSSGRHGALSCPCLSPHLFGFTTEVARHLVGVAVPCLKADGN